MREHIAAAPCNRSHQYSSGCGLDPNSPSTRRKWWNTSQRMPETTSSAIET
ncbi:MAG TPA: hypothetical protein VFB36_07880 [Nevskiaceae bacterium]|nr:hypothetical protein [Nevskiaceae bacterium]